MAKLTPTDVSSGYGATTIINDNLEDIATAIENTLSRDGTSPNQMEANLDMNSNRILNLVAAVSATEPVTLGQAGDLLDITVATQQSIGELLYPLTDAEIAAGVTPTDYSIPSHDAIGTSNRPRYASIDDAMEFVSVKFYSETITVTASLLMQENGQTLEGDGQYTSIIKAGGALGATDYVLDTNSKPAVKVYSLKIDGDNATKGLHVNNSFYGIYQRVDVRNCASDAITLTNSNNNVLDSVQVHSTAGKGIKLDATSQHNTLNAFGAEDWSGYGIEMLGIGNVLNGPWVENRASATYATDIGIYVNNRDNVIIAPEVRGAAGAELSVGIKLGASSKNTVVINPHFSNVTTLIETLGTNLYRMFFGVTAADITNTGGDTTTFIQKGNVIYSNVAFRSSAPVITYESTNGTSGVRYNVDGTASGSQYRWQVAGATKLELTGGTLLPGADDAQQIGSTTIRWSNVQVKQYVRTHALTVATLPAANTVGSGSRAFVSDANATTFASVVAGGGANGVPVYSDGTNWRIG